MMPEDNRGRTQVPKPLTTPATDTRRKEKSQAQDSANAPAETQPIVSTSASSTSGNATSKARKQGITPEAVTKQRSQPLRAPSFKKEPLKKPTTNDTTESVVFSEDVSTTMKPMEGAKDVPSAPVPEAEAPEPSESAEPSPPPQSEAATPASSPPASDPLQVAAQTYPWLYMSSTLDACFANVEQTAKKEPHEREKQTSEDETQLAGEEPRHDSQKVIEFRDELGSDTFAKEAPTIMQSFISFGEVCERVEAEAFQLAMSTPSLESREPLQAYSAMMDNLDNLREQASELESSILRLTGSNPTAAPSGQDVPEASSSATEGPGEKAPEPGDEEDQRAKQKLLEDANSARAQILGVFAACLPVLRARIANLSMAQELIDSAQENFSLALRMESMGIE